MNPLSMAMGASQFGIGALQAVTSGARKAEKALENFQVPNYGGNKSINDLYKTSLNKYNTSPYQSAAYTQAQQQVGRNFNAGLGSSLDRRSGNANIANLVGKSNDAMRGAGVVAEQVKRMDFNDLQQTTGMKSADDRMMFENNKMLPFQKQLQLMTYKAQAANSRRASAFQNMFGGLGSMTMAASGSTPKEPN